MDRKYIEGFGSIFRKAFKRKRTDGTEYVYECRTWEIAYYYNGQELREKHAFSGRERRNQAA